MVGDVIFWTLIIYFIISILRENMADLFHVYGKILFGLGDVHKKSNKHSKAKK